MFRQNFHSYSWHYHSIFVHQTPLLHSALSSRLTFFLLNLFFSSPIASSGFPPQRPRHLLLLVRGVTDSHLNVTEIDVNFILHLHLQNLSQIFCISNFTEI